MTVMKTLLSTVLLLQVADVSGHGRDGAVQAASSMDGPKKLWPVGELIPWWINTVDAYEGQSPMPAGDPRVLYAIRHYEEKTCLRFVACATLEECEAKPMWMEFWSGNGCNAILGAQNGKNRISIGPNCPHRTAVHEIGHDLGLDHEQKRRDRDDFVVVNTSVVETSRLSQFTKMWTGRDLGKYDYRGIMHYPMWAFQLEYGQVSVNAPFRLIGDTGGLSAGDVAALDFMYNGCSKQYTEPTCMASVDTEVTHVIPQDKPFLVTFASNYLPEDNTDIVLGVSYDASTLPASANVTYEFKGKGEDFVNGGAHSLITYTPSAAEAGETHALAMTVLVEGVPLKTCYAYVRVATTNTVCFGKEANDPFVCSGRGTCTGDVMQPCACEAGFAGPECEGVAECPRNVVDTFDTDIGDWAHGYVAEMDATHKVGATGSSLRLGHPDFLGETGDEAVLPLWSLSMPTRVSFDLAKFNTDVGGSHGVSFSVEPFQAGRTDCLFLSSQGTGERGEGPYTWSATNPSTSIVSTTSWTLVPEQFYHFEVVFDFVTMKAAVSIDGVVEITTSFNPLCTSGFDTVKAYGHGWLDNFDLHCTDFESPQHPETESPPATARPTPRPTPLPTPAPDTPAPTPMPAQCNDYLEDEEPGTIDRPEGDGVHARGVKDCKKLMCAGMLEVTFTLLDTEDADNTVTLSTFDSAGNEAVLGVYYGHDQPLPAPVSVWGNVMVRFVTAGSPFCIPGSCVVNTYKGYTLTWTCQTTASPTATPAPPTYVPTSAPPTPAPTAEPTIAPTPAPETFAPVSFPTFCRSSYLEDLRVGDVVHRRYKTDEEYCWMIQCNKHVSVKWLTMSTQEDHDFVRLYTRVSGSYEEVAVHTGATLPAHSQLPGYVLVRFSSDSDVSDDGFVIEYVCEDPVPTPEPSPTPEPAPFPGFCAVENTETDLVGDFQHPAVFGDEYGNDEEWCWMVRCSEQLTLTWVRFDTEADYDYVYVYTRDVNGDFIQVAQESGSTAPASQTYSGDVLVRFSSDEYVVAGGFAVTYECAAPPPPTPPTPPPVFAFPSYCAGHGETLVPGTLQHPAPPATSYGNNEDRCWHLKCAGSVRLTWVSFSTESGYDKVYVYSVPVGADDDAAATYHGSSTPTSMDVAGGALVHFNSDSFVTRSGFELTWTCVDI